MLSSLSRRRLAAVLVLAALMGVLGFLYNRTQGVDLDAQNRVMLSLRELEKLDAEWNLNLLRSHLGLNPDYQPLSAPLPRMRELQARLGAALPMTRGPDAARAYQALSAAMREKQALVTQFKEQNAVLRHALEVFPPAIADLKTELTGIEGALVPARTVLALDAALNALLTDVLRFNLAPEAALAGAIEQTIATVLAQKPPFSKAVGDAIDALVGHARTILLYRERENALEARIDATATGAAMDRLGILFDKSFDQVLLQQQRYRSYLFAYSGLLLLLLVYAARRLRRSYLIIGMVNQRLQAVNATLEQRVAARTAELEEQSERLRQLAHHDSLTGLINYGQLTRLLDHALLRASRRNTTVVVMFIDLDGFKAVNDTHGHATGDLVLQAVAQGVQAKLRKEDQLARLGGDEFVVLLEEVSGEAGALRVAQLTLDQIRGIDEAGGHPVSISASIGVASAWGRDGVARGAAALLAEADKAMYQAKRAGKNGIAISPMAQWGVNPATADAA